MHRAQARCISVRVLGVTPNDAPQHRQHALLLGQSCILKWCD